MDIRNPFPFLIFVGIGCLFAASLALVAADHHHNRQHRGEHHDSAHHAPHHDVSNDDRMDITRLLRPFGIRLNPLSRAFRAHQNVHSSVGGSTRSNQIAADTVVVSTTSGPVRGTVEDSIRVFRGIPYAASTGGSNRFRPPQARTPWGPAQTWDATTFGPGCIQAHHNPDVPKIQSEDCLNLNIYTPDSPAGTPFPVMVFFHGGAWLEGSNVGPYDFYDGKLLSGTGNTVVVTVNYRLGPFGFLATENVAGNMGIQDQRAALKWLQSNLQSFGGDPAQVTIWGESAGASSVQIHMTSPLSAGLFHRGIMESNPAGFHYRTRKEVQAYGRAMLKNLNCTARRDAFAPLSAADEWACLQSATPDTILSVGNKVIGDVFVWLEANADHPIDGFLPWTPLVDPDAQDLPIQPLESFQKGLYHRNVSLLVGLNNNEGDTFLDGSLKPDTPAIEVEAAFALVFGIDHLPELMKRYHLKLENAVENIRDFIRSHVGHGRSRRLLGFRERRHGSATRIRGNSPSAATAMFARDPFADRLPMEDTQQQSSPVISKAKYNDDWTPRDAFTRLLTDYWFRCGGENIALWMQRYGDHAYMYRFDHPLSFGAPLYDSIHMPFCANLTCHMAELPFVWHQSGNWSFTAVEEQISAGMRAYWLNFVRSGDPNVGFPVLEQWPEFDGEARLSMHLSDTFNVESSRVVYDDICDFWDKLGYDF